MQGHVSLTVVEDLGEVRIYSVSHSGANDPGFELIPLLLGEMSGMNRQLPLTEYEVLLVMILSKQFTLLNATIDERNLLVVEKKRQYVWNDVEASVQISIETLCLAFP